MMNIPVKIPWFLSPLCSNRKARMYRSLNVPKANIQAKIQLKNDYPMDAHRVLKILPQTKDNREEFDALMADHRNLNLIKVERWSFVDDETGLVIAMEDMTGDLLKTRSEFLGKGIPEKTLCFILKQAVQGLTYLHSTGEFHRNLDTWAIFYSTTKSPAIKLLSWAANFDFGVLSPKDRRITGNRRMEKKKVCCPERRGDTPQAYTSVSDVWHLGLTAIEMSLGELTRQNNAMADSVINAFRVAHQRPLNLNMVAKFPNMEIRGRLMKKSLSVRVLRHHFSPQFVDFVVQ